MAPSVVVIGAGVIGASIATRLAQNGAKVTVLTDRAPGKGTALASFAWFNAVQKYPIEYINMNMNGMRCHAEYAAKHGKAPWYHTGGNVECATEDAEAAILEKMQEFGYKAKRLSLDELRELEPDLDTRSFENGQIAYYPEEGWIDIVNFIAQLFVDARQAGAEIVCNAKVKAFEKAGDRIKAVQLASGERIQADIFINAAGANAGLIAGLAGSNLPMSNTPGVLVFTAPVAVTVNRVVHVPGLHIRPDGGGRLCVANPATDRAIENGNGLDDGIAAPEARYSFDLAAAKPLLDRLGEVYPAARDVPVEAARIGVRPIPMDRKPVIGFMPGVSNLYASTMHSGVTQCLWVGELVSRELVGGRDAPELVRFRPDRFLAEAQEARAGG